jgi:hypothetical protein
MRYNRTLVSVLVAIALTPASPLLTRSVAAETSHDHDRWSSDMNVKEQETIKKSFPMTAATQKSLEVDNVFGSIQVVASSTNEIQLVVTKTIQAESKAKIELAKKEVTLDITQDNNSVRLYVNGPFRCNCQDCNHGDRDSEYVVSMDFQIQVPVSTDLKLRTVNDGEIKVQGVAGSYAVNNINGGIEMLNVAGSGKVRTVNGGVKVTFRENPQANSEYASLNGNVELYFRENLAADFRFKTFNGGVHSDFPLTALPAHAPVEERRNGKFIFRSDRYTGGRVGSGGPEIKVENFNGEIRVLERHV